MRDSNSDKEGNCNGKGDDVVGNKEGNGNGGKSNGNGNEGGW